MISFDEAQRRVIALAAGAPLLVERVGIDAACGRVLGEDLRSPCDLPAFDHSSMDGYAVGAAAFSGEGPWTLPVVGESRAGTPPSDLVRGCACRIFTGAELPRGADAVVMQERVVRAGDRATFDSKPTTGAFVRRRGEDLEKGALALPRGTRLRPAHLGLAAVCDRAWLFVARRPVVTILCSGDELRAPGTPGEPGTIPESNSVALRAMAERAGAAVRVAASVGDDRGDTERALAAALEASDVLVTVGGVSVGDHDWVRPALEGVGVAIDFWKVAIKPGKPLVVGRRGRQLVLGLPGNPASAMVTFALFGVPLLRSLAGDRAPFAPRRSARLASAFHRAEGGRTEFVRVAVAQRDGETWATPLANQMSGASVSMAHADALLVIPEAATDLPQGALAEVLSLEELGA